MYQAKDAGRDAVAVFDESMRTRVEERVELEGDLHDAVASNQLHLVYQPIVHMRSQSSFLGSHLGGGSLSPANAMPDVIIAASATIIIFPFIFEAPFLWFKLLSVARNDY